jgi:hypothetical protein
MQRFVAVTVAISGLLLGSVAAPRPLKSESVSVTSATMIAFLPPALRAPTERGEEEAVAHLRFAVEDATKCLRPKQVHVVLAYADRLVLNSRGTSEVLMVKNYGQAIGVALAEPGRSTKVVAAEHGPSTLLQLLPAAAGQYWRAKGCVR